MIQKVYRAIVFHWYNTFSEGQESIRDEQRRGRSTTTRTRENIARIGDILKKDSHSVGKVSILFSGIDIYIDTKYQVTEISPNSGARGLERLTYNIILY